MHKWGNGQVGHTTWAADRVLIHVTGTGCQNFLTACSCEGIKLWKLHCAGNGYTAWTLGINAKQVMRLADKGGWQLDIQGRRGPGGLADRLFARPGIFAGVILAIALTKLFSLFVWNIDFAVIENPETIRNVLLDNGIIEGATMHTEMLQQTEQALQKDGENGWVSLHFTEGCLFVETNALRQQEIKNQETETALYSKSEALIISADVKSGFMAVEIGQYVTKGQLLVDNAKFGRTGNMVTQGAAGRVIGRIEKEYTATCDMSETQSMLCGSSHEEVVTWFMGRRYTATKDSEADKAVGYQEESWEPLRMGQLVLPGCRKITTEWLQNKIKVKHTERYAEATAKRACRIKLAADFPDAIVEKQRFSIEKDNKAVTAMCHYTLQADLAQRGAPPEHVFIKP